MNIFRRPLFLVLLVALPLFLGGAAKKPILSFAVHAEGKQTDGESFVMPVQLGTSNRPAFLSRMPLFTHREVDTIYPFPVDDGTMGCAFYLGAHGKALLDAHTVERRGTSVVVFLNGRQVIDLFVDKRIHDGLFVVPSGLTLQEVQLLEKQFKIKAAAPKTS